MPACLRPVGIGHLEDPEQQSRVALALRAARFGSGESSAGISAKWQARAGGLVAVALVASINLAAALALLLIWLAIGFQLTTSRYRAYAFLERSAQTGTVPAQPRTGAPRDLRLAFPAPIARVPSIRSTPQPRQRNRG
jgi:hypothetical protein